MKILTVISARGGSKRIPNKNIKNFCGKPLIAWTIEAALKAKNLGRVIVTTDNKKIASISEEYGAEVPFLRPPHLAKDETPGIDPVLHVISEISGYEWVLLLQPTSPLRDDEDINNMIEFSKTKISPSFVSITNKSIDPANIFYLKNDFFISHFLKNDKYLKSIGKDDVFILNGAMYLSKINYLLKKKSFVTNETIGYVMSSKKSIDIDNEIDWEIATFLKNNSNEK